MIFKTLHRKLKIEQQRIPLQTGINAGAPKGEVLHLA
jgi:hypothetical protein